MAHALEHVVEIDQDLVQRQRAGEDHALGVQALNRLRHAPLQNDAHHVADAHALGQVIVALMISSSVRFDAVTIRQIHGVVDLHGGAVAQLHLVDHRRMRVDDVERCCSDSSCLPY